MAFFQKKDSVWIDEQVSTIYQHYEDLKKEVSNAKELADGFHDRYKAAIRTGLDLKVFLTSELSHVNELQQHYHKQKIEAKEAFLRKEKAQAVLNSEIERMAVAYQHYPQCPFVNSQEFPELSHLYGAIDQFEHRYWYTLSSRLRREYSLTGNSPLTRLDQEIQQLVPPQEKHEPQALLLFVQHQRERSPDTEKYAMEAMKEVAFFLHDLHDLLDYLEFPSDEEAYRAIVAIIEAFRLASIKKRSF